MNTYNKIILTNYYKIKNNSTQNLPFSTSDLNLNMKLIILIFHLLKSQMSIYMSKHL
jgi:hypothetical protein